MPSGCAISGTTFRFIRNIVPFCKWASVSDEADDKTETVTAPGRRPLRADAQRNTDALLEAALAVFKTSGVDAPVREIAEQAGVGIGTVYRHFPQRADLIAAVFRREIDACADAATSLAAAHEPGEALGRWLQRYASFIATKRGLAPALHSGNPAFDSLRTYFTDKLQPALRTLLAAAEAAGEVRADVEPDDLLRAVGSLGMQSGDGGPEHTQRMVGLLVDGLRFGASSALTKAP